MQDSLTSSAGSLYRHTPFALVRQQNDSTWSTATVVIKFIRGEQNGSKMQRNLPVPSWYLQPSSECMGWLSPACSRHQLAKVIESAGCKRVRSLCRSLGILVSAYQLCEVEGSLPEGMTVSPSPAVRDKPAGLKPKRLPSSDPGMCSFRSLPNGSNSTVSSVPVRSPVRQGCS